MVSLNRGTAHTYAVRSVVSKALTREAYKYWFKFFFFFSVFKYVYLIRMYMSYLGGFFATSTRLKTNVIKEIVKNKKVHSCGPMFPCPIL